MCVRLDEVTRDLLVVRGGHPREVENLTGPAGLRMAVRLSGVAGADVRLDQAAMRIDLQHHYGQVRATELWQLVDDLCSVLPDLLRGIRPAIEAAGASTSGPGPA